MKWVRSSGGPLICGEEHVSARWKGIGGLSSDSDYKNDYERACSTQEYLEKMVCANKYVLVLGDEPLQSAFFWTESVDVNLAIARWVYAESSDGAEKFLKEPVNDVKVLAPAVPFEVIEGLLVLFDSAMPGLGALAGRSTANVQPGSYLVTTEEYQMDKKFSFVVHRFLKT